MTSPSATHLTEIDLDIGGMTCASCAARVEKKLNKLPGVTATVNYATERAHVALPSDVSVADAIATVEATGYTASRALTSAESKGDGDIGDSEVRSLRERVTISAVLTIPLVLMAMIPILQFDYWQWLSLTLAAPVVVWGALPFHRAAWINLRHGAATMDTLVSMGVGAAFLWSLYALFLGGAGEPGMRMSFHLLPTRSDGTSEIYLEVAAAVTTFILLGRYFEVRAKQRSSTALTALLSMGAKDVAVMRDGHQVRIPIQQLSVGDDFVVRPGEKVATDGEVVEGRSAVDMSLLTGEPIPQEVGPGDSVVGAGINTFGRLIVRATRVGSDTHLARIAALVEQAQTQKAPVQRLADRISAVFVPIVIAIAALTAVGWIAAGAGFTFAFTAAVAVLIIACPCALGLATPTALLVGTGRGAQLGIVIRGPQILEATRTIDAIALDKTGTLTEGRMTVADVLASDDRHANEVLALVAAVESASEHPIGQAIAASIDSPARVDDFVSAGGHGVHGVVDGMTIVAGKPAWLTETWSVELPDDAMQWIVGQQQLARTVVVAAANGRYLGAIAVADAIKPTSHQAIAELTAMRLRPVLVTGDNRAVAEAVARQLGIDEVCADVLPEGKIAIVRELQSNGQRVAMVGDGVNDAAALAQADLGMAMGSGTDVAIEASDITLMRSDPRSIVDAIRLSRRTLTIIKGNLFWAFAYNVAAIPLAVAGLLNPMIAGAAMAFSSAFVVTNSLRLRRFRSAT
ncbi:MAG: heavy metal translocating P-type ATPase [Candidatus Nanopelagicales bacterium]